MKKQSKAAEIRTLLAEGKTVEEIAKIVKKPKPYVIQVRWHWRGGLKGRRKAKTAKKHQIKKFSLPVSIPNAETPKDNFVKWVRGRIEEAEDKAAMSIATPLFGSAQPKQEGGAWWLDYADKEKSEADMVNNPDHYVVGGIETIDFIEAKKLGYNLGNAVKYISRADYKGKRIEDLKKAIWYIQREIGK